LNQYYPTYVSPPGETLLEMIEEAGLTPESFADRANLDHKKIIELIEGKASLTEEIALQLEKNLQVPADFWMRREQNYRLSLEQRKSRVLIET
jgi:HTH-type transcriptional regulator / antitoxin HigA